MAKRVDLRLDEELVAAVDVEAKRLNVSRTVFVEGALRHRLGHPGGNDATIARREVVDRSSAFFAATQRKS